MERAVTAAQDSSSCAINFNKGFMYYRWEEIIKAEECNAIINEFKDSDYTEGKVKNGSQDARCASIHWVDPRNLLNRAIQSFMLEANNKLFNYAMETSEILQFGKYGVGGKYDWHQDASMANEEKHRKLSTTVQLSNPEDYEGGDFQFFSGAQEPEDLKIRKQGSVVVFDSRDWHRLTPVTKGIRYSLVLWSSGRRFI